MVKESRGFVEQGGGDGREKSHGIDEDQPAHPAEP